MKSVYYNQIHFKSMFEIQCGKNNRMTTYIWAIFWICKAIPHVYVQEEARQQLAVMRYLEQLSDTQVAFSALTQ